MVIVVVVLILLVGKRIVIVIVIVTRQIEREVIDRFGWFVLYAKVKDAMMYCIEFV